MALMLSKTYDAFRKAGVPESDAKAAAEEIARLDIRLTRMEAVGVLTFAGVVALLVRLFGG